MPKIPLDQKTNEFWLDLRKNHIGASEVAALFQMHPYTTAYEMFHLKKGNIKPPKENALMRHGRIMEPIIAQYIAEAYRMDIEKCNVYLEHPEHKHLGCTLDFYVIHSEDGRGILEIKNVSSYSSSWTNTRAPNYVEIQVQHQLLVANAVQQELGEPEFAWAAIGSMHQGNPEDIRLMMRHKDAIVQEEIIKRSSMFWNQFTSNKSPKMEGSKDYECFVSLAKESQDQDIELIHIQDKNMDELVFEYLDTKAKSLDLEKKEKEIKSNILSKIQEMTTKKNVEATCDAYRISTHTRSSIRKAQPEKVISSFIFNVKPFL